jgi:hypothetical protein
MLVLVLNLIRNVSFITILTIRRTIDRDEDSPMRPHTNRQMSRHEMEAFACMQAYLLDPQDDGADEHGNTKTHLLVKHENSLRVLESQLGDNPHHLFMLNKEGQTPLDLTI